MRRIGEPLLNRFLPLVAIVIIGLLPVGAVSQNVSVTATVPNDEVFTGERIPLAVEISGNDFSNLSRPDLPDFPSEVQLLSNNASTSRSYSFVNGRAQSSYTYTYYLVARKAGVVTLPKIAVQVDGRRYQTNTIKLTIIDRNQGANRTGGRSKSPDIYLKLEVSDTNPVPGQQLLADVMLYFKSGVEVLSYQPSPGWKAEGFWKEQLESNKRPQAVSTIIDGVRFRKARLMQFALFPTKPGELELSPYTVQVSVQTASRGRDPLSSFFSGFNNSRRNVELNSDRVAVTVRKLSPPDNAVEIGAVGSFNISRTISTEETFAGESIEIITKIDGTGNIPLISKPEYELPASFEIYDPQDKADINRRGKQIVGTRTFTDIVIARTPGSYTIPETRLAYYDPDAGRYRTTRLPAATVRVKRDPNAAKVTSATNISFNVQPILGLASWKSAEARPFELGYLFWIGLALPALMLAVGYWQKSYRDRMSSDRNFARAQTATDRARETLKEAMEQADSGDIKEAYRRLHKALTGFISDRLGLPEAGLSDEEFIDRLAQEKVSQQTREEVKRVLTKCSTISYAPMTSSEDLKQDLERAETLFSTLKKTI